MVYPVDKVRTSVELLIHSERLAVGTAMRTNCRESLKLGTNVELVRPFFVQPNRDATFGRVRS